jgi:predicted metalloprotease
MVARRPRLEVPLLAKRINRLAEFITQYPHLFPAHNADQARQLVEAGDIDEALNAASAVGDDTIQKRVQGHVNQESFTHGSGAERQQWFRKGYASGSVQDCNTFQ